MESALALHKAADEPLRWLGDRMIRAAERWDFEYAASLRDRLERLERLREEFSRLREALDSLTFRIVEDKAFIKGGLSPYPASVGSSAAIAAPRPAAASTQHDAALLRRDHDCTADPFALENGARTEHTEHDLAARRADLPPRARSRHSGRLAPDL